MSAFSNSSPSTLLYKGADLERWRVSNGLTKHHACELFGLQRQRWEDLVGQENAERALDDVVVAMLLYAFEHIPNASPVRKEASISEFYKWLGLGSSTSDIETFARAIGRSRAAVYRLVYNSGQPGRPVQRWLETVERLNLPPAESLKLMCSVADRVSHADSVQVDPSHSKDNV